MVRENKNDKMQKQRRLKYYAWKNVQCVLQSRCLVVIRKERNKDNVLSLKLKHKKHSFPIALQTKPGGWTDRVCYRIASLKTKY